MDDDLPVGVYAIFDIKYTRMLTNSLCVSRLEHFYWETMVTNDQFTVFRLCTYVSAFGL